MILNTDWSLEGERRHVVDDGSRDETPGVRRHGREHGPAAPNRALALTSSRLIAFAEDDCIPKPDWLEYLVTALESGPLFEEHPDGSPCNTSMMGTDGSAESTVLTWSDAASLVVRAESGSSILPFHPISNTGSSPARR